MSWPEIIAYAAVLFVGVPSMLRSWTAVALVGSFILVEGVWAITGAGPGDMRGVEIMGDYCVVITVLIKAIPADCIRREIEQVPGIVGASLYALRNCVGYYLDLNRADKIILALFVPAWAAYGMGEWLRYWVLWGAGILQIIVAGADAFATWRKGRDVRAEVTPADWFFRQGLAVDGC